jgi:methyl-accepting chemotaxis protein
LLATGYAVVARLHLQSVSPTETPAGPEQVLEQYLERSGVLLDNVELTIVRFGSLAETVMTETRRVIDKSRGEFAEVLGEVIRTLDQQLRVTFESVAESVAGIRTLINDPSFIAEQKSFARTIRSSAAVSDKLKVSLDTLNGSVATGTDSFGRAHSAMEALGESADRLNSGLALLASDSGPLVKIAEGMQAASEGSERAASQALEAANGIVQLSGRLTSSQDLLHAFGQSANTAGDQLDRLATACSGLDTSMAHLADAMKASQDFAAVLANLGQGLPELVPNVHLLGEEFGSLTVTLGTTAASLESDVRRSTDAVELLASNLAAVAQTIIDRTRERQLRI